MTNKLLKDLQALDITITEYENLIRQKAYDLWKERGQPIGDPDKDWYEAKSIVDLGIIVRSSLNRVRGFNFTPSDRRRMPYCTPAVI